MNRAIQESLNAGGQATEAKNGGRANDETDDEQLKEALKASELEAMQNQNQGHVKDSQEYDAEIQKAMQESLKA